MVQVFGVKCGGNKKMQRAAFHFGALTKCRKPNEQMPLRLKLNNDLKTGGRIFSWERPFYEQAVSDLDP